MTAIKGKITISQMYEGSKSEGEVTTLTTPDNKSYILHRKDALPQNDSFFQPFNEKEVGIEGTIDSTDNYICVVSVTLPDGNNIIAPKLEFPVSSSPMFINKTSAEDITGKENKKEFKRLPRKLKKKLKKQNNNTPFIKGKKI